MKNKALLKRNLIFALVLTALYVIYSFVLTPVYTEVCSNVIYIDTYLPYVFEILFEICQIFIWCHLFSHLISHFCLEFTRRSFFIFIFTAIVTALRYFFEPILALFFSSDASYLWTDALTYFILDAVQIAVIAILAMVLIGERCDASGLKPFGRINARPLSRVRLTALIAAALIAAVRIIMRVIFDVFYGAPESVSEILLMVVYYMSDILYGFISYLFIVLFIRIQCKTKDSK